MEEYTPDQQPKSEEIKRWFQDNMRILVSVIIVVLIAGGIYSYSKRSEAPVVSDTASESVAEDQISSDTATNIGEQKTTDNSKNEAVSSAATSKETESSFVETAAKGDGLTVLARRATADYLEKNPDSTLTKEHKIYIEDFLRKNVKNTGGVHIGTSVEFSKDLIQKAIEKSKNLNENQLKNLQKYSARVTSLS